MIDDPCLVYAKALFCLSVSKTLIFYHYVDVDKGIRLGTISFISHPFLSYVKPIIIIMYEANAWSPV